MRISGLLGVGLLGVVISASSAWALTYVPAETPPAGFTGRQYVDSKGCAFVRAGLAGATTWVARINRDQSQVCGYKPTLDTAKAATPVVVPDVTVATVKPVAPSASRPKNTSVVAAAPVMPTVTQKAPVAHAPRRVRVVHHAPGTRARGSVYSNEVSVGGLAPVRITSEMPEGGWEPAFDDGRLNPFRGPRSAAGTAQMEQSWSQSVPMKMIAQPRPRTVAPTGVQVTRAHAGMPTGGRFVQAGSFSAPGNADAARVRLQALGLPVSRGHSGRFTVIYAGPFASHAAAIKALPTVRRAGFGDAFVR
ncbi:SPOR domain-containing protein [Thioclava sp. BHET1]|nr:SPOR domain-containing protein [Thioclava sp. BHET1]